MGNQSFTRYAVRERRGNSIMADTLEQTDVQGNEHEHLQGKVTFHEPDMGWSAESYERELGEYVAVRGRAPQSVTMHPETAAALGLDDENADPALTRNVPFLVTSSDYDRDTITLYF
jgi:hypothetical protein